MARVTMSDVAKLARVSMKSVSRVINREPNVTEKLRARVQEAIDSLGYVPDLVARSLAASRAFAIGIVFDNPSPNYTMKLQAGAYQACRAHGFHLLIENIDSANGVAEQMRAILHNVRVDGFILTPPLCDNPAIMDLLEARGIPFVRIAAVSDPERAPLIAIDDFTAAGELADHLWKLGHRRFGLANGPAEHGAALLRRAGFIDSLGKPGEAMIVEADAGFLFEQGIKAAGILMAADPPPTAIFAANDDSAAGVMSGLAQLGFRVPDDVSVVGFDDSWVAKSVWPYLTTIRQPIAEMAYAAAELLIDRNAEREPGTMLIDYALVVRDSTGPAKP